MKTETIVEVIKKIEETTSSKEEQEHFSELMALISEMNIVDFEPNLSEDLNAELGSSFPGKYEILASLRDLFLEFKNEGDNQIIVEKGTCGHRCSRGRNCQTFNLQGNNSGKNFAFGFDKSEESFDNFHTCYGFLDKNNKPKYIDGDMAMKAIVKDSARQGKSITMDDAEILKGPLLRAIKGFYKK